MTRSVMLLAVATGAMVLVPGALAAQAVPQFSFSVRNNTSISLPCEFRIGGEEWRAIELEPGSEWRESGESADAVAQVRCKPPVRQVAYQVTPGNRYAFLRKTPQSAIKLRKIDPQ